jgi:CHAT domain-containing protein
MPIERIRLFASSVSGLLLLTLVSPIACKAQAGGAAPPPAQAPIVLSSGEAVSAEVPAGGTRTLTIAACAGCFAEVRIEQMDNSMPMAILTGPGISSPLSRSCDSGIHSVLRIPFIAPQSANYDLEIRLAKPPSGAIRIRLVSPRPANASDFNVVAAYDAMARAESLRRAPAVDTAANAIASYDRTFQLAQTVGDRGLQQRALTGKARIYLYKLGDYTAALKTAEEAGALMGNRFGESPQSVLAADAATWKVLSSAYYFLARYPEMIDATDRSLALYAKLGDLYWQGILEGNAASVYAEIGEMQQALSAAERALDIAEQLSDLPGIAFTRATIAAIHFERGEYQAAIDADQAALEEIRIQPYPDEEGQVWLNLAEIYDELNDFERERDALERCLPLLRNSGNLASESTALEDLGILYLRKMQSRKAAESLDQSMRIAQSHSLRREEAMAWLGKSELLAAEHQVRQALAAAGSGQMRAMQAGEAFTSALLLQEEGDLQTRLGDAPAAMTTYRKAESSWSAIPNPQHAALARASIARIESRSGHVVEARNDILHALDGFEASRNKISGRSLRESFFTSVHDFYDLAIEISMSTSSRAAARNRDAEDAWLEAWTIAERARARSLVDTIRESSPFSTRGVPQSLIDRSSGVERQIVQTQQNILRLSSLQNAAAPLQTAKDQLHALIGEEDDIEARERESSSASLFSAAWHLPSIDSLRARLLDSETELLEYWVGKRHAYLWLITSHSMRAVRLCSSPHLAAAVSAYRKALLAREQSPPGEDLSAREARIAQADRELNVQAERLGSLLLPLRPASEIHRLVVVPDNIIASVPFSALRFRLRDGFLIENYEVTEEPSAAVAMELLSRPEPSPNRDAIAIFADPVYNLFDPRLANTGGASSAVRITSNRGSAAPPPSQTSVPVLRSDADLDLSALPRLRASAEEAKAISSIAGAGRVHLYLGLHATAAAVIEIDWSHFFIAHFATHALVDSARPELSGIVLSTFDKNGSPQNGIFWLHDIYRTPMPLPLVVLSGCRTAGGAAIPGEGISGLAQAFLSSGASTVVGSLWTVDDAVAGKMVPWFYQALLNRHMTISGALRIAQLRMVAAGSPPYDWAGYIVEGNWRIGTVSPAH